MASFGVHLSVGAVAGGAAATCMLVAGLATRQEVMVYFVLATLGGLLPDLDADSSVPVQVAFSLASILLAFLVLFLLAGTFATVLELLVIWALSYLFFRWLMFGLFTRLTVHRGVFHSVPAALLFAFVTAILSQRAFEQAPLQAWMNGLFVAFGYLVHLLLDELHSANLFGVRAKKSFGTAFKLWSRGSLAATLYLYVCTFGLYLVTPPLQPVQEAFAEPQVLRQLRDHLVPRAAWFTAADAVAGSE